MADTQVRSRGDEKGRFMKGEKLTVYRCTQSRTSKMTEEPLYSQFLGSRAPERNICDKGIALVLKKDSLSREKPFKKRTLPNKKQALLIKSTCRKEQVQKTEIDIKKQHDRRRRDLRSA